MPLYEYVASDFRGRKLKGRAEAPDENELYKRLKQQDQYITSCKAVPEEVTSVEVKSKELADFAHQLGTMLCSGITLTRALTIVAQRCPKAKYKGIYSDLNLMVQQGMLLSDSMEKIGKSFPELMINMIRAGETSGDLGKVCLKLSDHYEKDNKLKMRVRNAMTYPAIVMCLTVGVVVLIFTVILPEFFDLFESMEEIPWTTQFLMNFSRFLTGHVLLCTFGAGIMVVLFLMLLKTKNVRRLLDWFKIKLPVLKGLMRTVYTARFARGLSSLYSSGLSMIQSLQICRGLIGNTFIADFFEKMVNDVKNGVPLSTAISTVSGFDGKLASSIYVGEESGKIDSILENLADVYDYESEKATQQLLTFIEPLMIIVMALIVGTIMVSVILPIYQYYQTLSA